uniref:Ion transport domain-containing protein n=1 Tax=Hanusia phi TaxID=3032 RepID=A0A7S0EEW1_9CRYP
MANFAAKIVEIEMQLTDNSFLDALEMSFTIIFTIELSFNAFANWFRDFFFNGWNLFDTLVVSVSIIGAALPNVPGVSVLRLFRVFRVLRLFHRLSSLRIIINAVTASILPVANAFVVLLLITAIYAVLACMLFKSRDEVLFGKFSSALFSMFQVCTGDGWSTDVVRPMFGESGVVDGYVVLFFVSYILIGGYFLLNVVVAVLLDEFASAVDMEKRRLKEHQDTLSIRSSTYYLDPLLEFLSQYQTEKDLKEKIRVIFDILAGDDDKTLSYEKFLEGVYRLNFKATIAITQEDWEVLMEATPETSGKKEITWQEFEQIILAQLNEFACRQASLKQLDADEGTSAVILILKQLQLEVRKINQASVAQDEIRRQMRRLANRIALVETKFDSLLHGEIQNGGRTCFSSSSESEGDALDRVDENAILLAVEHNGKQRQLKDLMEEDEEEEDEEERGCA